MQFSFLFFSSYKKVAFPTRPRFRRVSRLNENEAHWRWKFETISVRPMWQRWLDGLGVWFSLRVREVPGSIPGQAQPDLFLLSDSFIFSSLKHPALSFPAWWWWMNEMKWNLKWELYVELKGSKSDAGWALPPERIELSTSGLQDQCFATEL